MTTVSIKGIADLPLRHHRERKETIADLIDTGLQTATALSDALWGKVETSQVYLALSEVVGHTDLLVAEGRLTEEEADYGSVAFARRFDLHARQGSG